MSYKKTLLLGLSLFVFIPVLVFGATFHLGNDFVIHKGNNVEGNVYAFAQNITVAGSVNGDVIAAGNSILLSEEVNKDASLVGTNVNVVAPVNDDLRIISGTSLLSGKVGGDLIVISANGRTLPTSSIAGDIIATGGKITLEGEVLGRVVVSAKTVYINGPIGGDLRITADEIYIGENAKIAQGFWYKSVREAHIAEGASFGGEISYNEVVVQRPDENLFSFLWSSWFLVRFITIFVSALILYTVLGKSLSRLSLIARKDWWLNIGAGFIFVAGSVVAPVLLLFTVIGIPLALATIALSFLFFVVSIALSPIILGSYVQVLLKKGEHISWKTVLLGASLFMILGLIPIVGFIIRFVISMLSLGVIVRVMFAKMQIMRE